MAEAAAAASPDRRPLLALLAAIAISETGNRLSLLAVPWFVLQTTGSATQTGVAYRMLGSLSEADDAVQEAWLRLSGADADSVHNLGGWLTTVVGRVCLDMLRSRAARREESLDADAAVSAMRRACCG